MIYILFPTPAEFEPLSLLVGSPEGVTLGRRYGISGRLAGREVTAVVSGIGQANTAQAMTAILETGGVRLVIMGGCAGAYPGSGLGIGDVAVATRETYAGLGVETPEGFRTLAEIGLPLLDVDGVRRFDTFDLPAWPVEQALNINPLSLRERGWGEGSPASSPSPPGGEGGWGAGDVSSMLPLPAVPSREGRGVYISGEGAGGEGSPLGVPGVRVFSGPFLTVSTVSGTAARGRELFARYGALCENMEGAAAAQVAELYGVPFAEVRGISNMVEDRDRESWDIPLAAANCARVIESIVASLQ